MAREIRARLDQAPQARSDGYGIDHNMWIAISDLETASHLPCTIPLERYGELTKPMSDVARADLYKALIIEFYNVSVPSPEIPQAPTSLQNLAAWDTYYDEKADYDAALAENVATATTYATMADNWIRSLSTFTEYPFAFTLQPGD